MKSHSNGLVVGWTAMLVALPAASQETVSRSQKNQPISITYGRVISIEQVKVSSNAGGGAAVGGMVGLAIAHDNSTGAKVGMTAAGALLGGILTHAAEGKHKANAYTVRRQDGSTLKIIQDHADVSMGDCVSVEQGQTSNVRRISDEMCGPAAPASDTDVQASHAQDAGECNQAKQEVLAAKTDDDFARAERKVKILCD